MKVTATALIAHLEALGLILSKQGTLPSAAPELELVRDSRQAAPSAAFFAYQGVAVDSHRFIPAAVDAGTPLIIHDQPYKMPAEQAEGCLAVQVTNSREAWAHAWSLVAGLPGDKLTMIGITGTNGKSSVTWLIHKLLTAQGQKGMLIGTIGAGLEGEAIPLRHTTPDPEVLYPLLARAVAAGCTYAVMEVASHAIAQGKLVPLKFAFGGFTSFSRDHLDLHGTLAEYFAIKAQLFDRFAAEDQQGFVHSGVAPRIKRQLTELQMNRITIYGGSGEQASYSFTDLSFAGAELSLKAGQRQLLADTKVPLVTEFQLANLSLALLIADGLCGAEGLAKPWEEVVTTVPLAVPGRMETVTTDIPGSPLVVIDYSHTPDAVAKALQALRALKAPSVTVIVGCGGDRDPGKRPLMAKAAIAGADKVVFTTDNPRTEAPLAILADMTEGLDLTKDNIEVIVDRVAAIRFAVEQAAADEVILLAGKGHEAYQEVNGERRPFDEPALVREAFALKASSSTS